MVCDGLMELGETSRAVIDKVLFHMNDGVVSPECFCSTDSYLFLIGDEVRLQ